MIWFLFALWISFLLIFHRVSRKKNRYFYLVLISLIVFSTFRDGLGYDYRNYLLIIDRIEDLEFYEPSFLLLAYLVNNTALSEVFLFLVYSILINSLFLLFFRRFRYFEAIVFLYLIMPVFYFNSFNIMRQYAAIAVFLYSTKYVLNGQYKKLILSIILMALLHFSSILIAPIYLIINKKIARARLLLLYAMVVFCAPLLKVFIEKLILMSQYDIYAESTFGVFFNTSIIIANLIFLLSLCKKRLFESGYYNIIINMLFVLVCLVNLSLFVPSFFRLAFYFQTSIIIALTNLARVFSKRSQVVYCTFLISIFISVFLRGVVLSLDNFVAPRKILAPSSLVDKYYAKDRIYYLRTLKDK